VRPRRAQAGAVSLAGSRGGDARGRGRVQGAPRGRVLRAGGRRGSAGGKQHSRRLDPHMRVSDRRNQSFTRRARLPGELRTLRQR
jgi:hypothetical protein